MKRFSDRGLTLEGTQQLMVLLSESTDAGTSMPCPGKRHLRLFWACTEQPSHVVLTITVSVAISPGQICFALSCFVQALDSFCRHSLTQGCMVGKQAAFHWRRLARFWAKGTWAGGFRDDPRPVSYRKPQQAFRHHSALSLDYFTGQLRCECTYAWRMQTCKSHPRPYFLPACRTQGVRRWHAPG